MAHHTETSKAPEDLASAQQKASDLDWCHNEYGFGDVDGTRVSLRHAFAAFDADGDGYLTEGEVMAALTRKTGKGTELSEEVARATWQRWKAEFDRNNDGKISYGELAQRT